MTRIIGVASGKGGVGKTTFATNLAIALTKFAQKVVLIDCNVTTPHLSYYLGADTYSFTVNDVLRKKIDIEAALSNCYGVLFLPASTNVADLANIEIRDLKNHVKKLDTPLIDFVLLDSAPGLGREAVSVLEACDEVFFVTTPTIPNLADVKRCVEVVKELNHKRLGLVLNMVDSARYEFPHQEVEKLIKMPVLGKIPFDKNVIEAVAVGEPVLLRRPNSPASAQYMQLAASLVGKTHETKEASVFSRIFGSLKRNLKTFHHELKEA
jgi:MinD-like ATPase involved in chromosome partitioning or flagellar assembly